MKKRKVLLTTAIVLAVAAAGFFMFNPSRNRHANEVSSITLSASELVSSISAKGTVESVDTRNVYPVTSGMIKTVAVKVGDKVTEGQVLCVLNTDDLELNIAQQKAELTESQLSSLNQLQNNQRIYQEAVSNFNQGTNTQMSNAEGAVKTAEENLKKAQNDYDDALDKHNRVASSQVDGEVKVAEENLKSAKKTYEDTLKEYNEGTNSQITSAESNLTSTKLDLDTKQKTYEDNKVLFEAGAISASDLEQSEIAHTNALNKYNDALTSYDNAETAMKRSLEQAESSLNIAQVNYDNAVDSTKKSLEQAENSLNIAKISYNNAVDSLNTTNVTSKQELDKYKSNVESSQISANSDVKVISIQRLEKQLEDSTITSPISGTVTAVYAKEGSNASGLLFVVEDTEHLKITSKIKEYDVNKLELGMDVIIKSDSTGDASYDGKISKIDPTALKNASGETSTDSDVEFSTEIEVLSTDTDLKVGMNARLNIVIEKKNDVFSVPFDAIKTGANNESVVYTAVMDKKDQYVANPISVVTGLETDFYVEISGNDLVEGMEIISDVSKIQDGMKFTLKGSDSDAR